MVACPDLDHPVSRSEAGQLYQVVEYLWWADGPGAVEVFRGLIETGTQAMALPVILHESRVWRERCPSVDLTG
jgi:hypothetical protein